VAGVDTAPSFHWLRQGLSFVGWDGLGSNSYHWDLYLSSSWNYRREPPCLARSLVLAHMNVCYFLSSWSSKPEGSVPTDSTKDQK
jgi:hypothetical protein